VDETRALRGWLVDVLVGGIVGGVAGAIIAVNLVIFAGIERGYEATIPEVLRENTLIGVLTIVVLAAGPILGVVVARRTRRRRGRT
jgi:hypothetical protein